MKAQSSVESLILVAILLAGGILLAQYFYELQPTLALISEIRINLNDCLSETNSVFLLTDISVSNPNIYLSVSPDNNIPSACISEVRTLSNDYFTDSVIFVNNIKQT